MTSPELNKKEILLRHLKEWCGQYRYFSYPWIRDRLAASGPSFSANTLRDYLSEARERGVIHSSGRGWYSSLPRAATLDASASEPLRKLLRKRFPFLPHYVWSTGQINPWMHHQLGKFVAFVTADTEAVKDVSSFLREEGWLPVVNPGKKSREDFPVGERVVVVRGARRTIATGLEPRTERVLIDLMLENGRLGLMDEADRREASRKFLSENRVDIAFLCKLLSDHKQTLAHLIGRPLEPIITEK